MANGKVKKYFKNLEKMMEENKQKTRPTGSGTGKGINVKTPGKGQSGVGVTKQGKKPKKGDEIKQPPLESKHAGEVNLDNVEKAQTNAYKEVHDKQSRAYNEPPTKKMEDAKPEIIDKFGQKLDTVHELPRKILKKNGKNKKK